MNANASARRKLPPSASAIWNPLRRRLGQPASSITQTKKPTPTGKKSPSSAPGPVNDRRRARALGHDVSFSPAQTGWRCKSSIPGSACPRRSSPGNLGAAGVKIQCNVVISPHLHDSRTARAIRRHLSSPSGADLPRVHERPQRKPQRRLLRQRVPHAHQSDDGVPNFLRHPGAHRQTRRRRRRWQHPRWTRSAAKRLGAEEAKNDLYRHTRELPPAPGECITPKKA